MFLVFIVLSCYFFIVQAFDDLGGGLGNLCFHLRGRILKTHNEMGAFILRSSRCDAELRIGAARGRCRPQSAPASRLANCDVNKTQARGGTRRIFDPRLLQSRHQSFAVFDGGDACLFGTLNPNLANTSAHKKNFEMCSNAVKIRAHTTHPFSHPGKNGVAHASFLYPDLGPTPPAAVYSCTLMPGGVSQSKF